MVPWGIEKEKVIWEELYSMLSIGGEEDEPWAICGFTNKVASYR